MDPGAVPGASTNKLIWGRISFDMRDKEIIFVQKDTAGLIDKGSFAINANENRQTVLAAA